MLLQIGKEFGLEGQKLLEFVEKQQKLEEEKEEKRRQVEEEREERRRILEEDRRKEEEEKEERRRREDEERETRRQERELRKSELEAEISKLKEAAEAAKRKHELKLAWLAQGNLDGRIGVREDRAKAPKLLSFVDGKNVKSCIENDELLLACGKKVPLLSSACVEPLSGVRSKVPVVKGRVGEKSADDPDPSWQDHVQAACTLSTRSQAAKAEERRPLKVQSSQESPAEEIKERLRRETERSDELCEPPKEVDDRIQRLSEALTQEQVRGVERDEAMRHLQDSLNDERRRLSKARDALDKEMQLTKQLEETLSFEEPLKLEIERKLDESKANLAEVTKAEEALQQELHRNKSLMYETVSKLRVQEGEARQKDEVSDELKSELDTLRGNCIQREDKQFTGAEKLAKSKTPNRERRRGKHCRDWISR